MRKKILAVLLLLLIWTLPVMAQEEGKWQRLTTPSQYSYYLDLNSIEYDARLRQVSFWQKVVYPNSVAGSYSLYRVDINFKDKTSRASAYAFIKNNQTVEQHTMKNAYSYITPDSTREVEANVLAEKFGLAKIYPQDAGRWRWIKATDKNSLYVLSKAVSSDKENCYIWVKYVPVKGNPWRMRYACSLTQRALGFKTYPLYKTKMKQVLPDTLEEAIYNAALRAYKISISQSW